MTTQFVLSEYLINKTNLLIAIINPIGNVEYISPAVEKMLGFSSLELLGNNWWEKTRNLEEAEIVKTKLIQLFQKPIGFTEAYEHELNTNYQTKKWIRWEVTKISDSQLIAIGQDITQRKNYENSLNEQLKLLKEKNKNITDSIQYARRLQNFILKQPENISKHFSDSFVLYLPKDIISGDYYAFYELEDKFVIVLADCTGHGVPGAMMSFLVHSILREIIISNHNEKPSDILFKVDDVLYELLNKNSDEFCLDGLDAAIVFINKEKTKLQFAGAYRPLVVISDSTFESLEFAKNSIGFSDEPKQFFTVERNLKANDTLYFFSDGYADQFGGLRNKKLNKKNFYQILSEIQPMTLKEQASFLEYTLNNWKQQNDQTDDITIIGLRI